MKSVQCPCCGAGLETDAECLLRIGYMIQSRPGKLTVAEGGVDFGDLARVKVALDLAKKLGLALQVLVEE